MIHITLFFFDRLFKTNSSLKYIFTHFSKLETEDDMRRNEALEHHATFVMTTLDEAISNIDNYNYVTDHLHRTGATHQRFIDFSSENFGVSLLQNNCPLLNRIALFWLWLWHTVESSSMVIINDSIRKELSKMPGECSL